MKTFEMIREADESGVSGTGKVLEGIVFGGGKTVVQWCVEGKPNSTVVYDTFEDFKFIHVDSHPTNGTKFNWLNGEPSQAVAQERAQLREEVVKISNQRGTVAADGVVWIPRESVLALLRD